MLLQTQCVGFDVSQNPIEVLLIDAQEVAIVLL